MFNTRLPAIKLIGIKENKELIKKASKLIFFDEINIFDNIKYNLHYFNINIILISLKKDIKIADVEALGANFYDLFKDLKQSDYWINSDSLSSNSKNIIGHFLHGLKLKSYKFDKYKTKKIERI